MNARAVLSKIVQLRKEGVTDEEWYASWQKSISVQEIQESSRRPGRERKAGADVADAGYSEEEIEYLQNNKDFIAECVQKQDFIKSMLELAEDDDGESAFQSVLSDWTYIQDCIGAKRQMSDIGYEDVVPNMVAAMSKHGRKVTNWPTMVRHVQNWSKMLTLEKMSGMRWSEQDKQYHATVLFKCKGDGYNFLRGHGESRANPGDDGGRSHRESGLKRKRTEENSVEEVDADDGMDDDEDGMNVDVQENRYNNPMMADRTVKHYWQDVTEGLKTAGVCDECVDLHAERMRKSPAGSMNVLYMDKVCIAKKHPGNRLTHEGETRWNGAVQVEGCMAGRSSE
jgi:hypothetical protein